MIQRIQTIYLLLVAVLSIGMTFLIPYGLDDQGGALFANKNPMVFGFFVGSGVLALIAIFLFKNRKLQFVLGRLNIILNVSEKGIGMLIPIISIVLLVIANKAIKKDEHLVKSVDRLR